MEHHADTAVGLGGGAGRIGAYEVALDLDAARRCAPEDARGDTSHGKVIYDQTPDHGVGGVVNDSQPRGKLPSVGPVELYKRRGIDRQGRRVLVGGRAGLGVAVYDHPARYRGQVRVWGDGLHAAKRDVEGDGVGSREFVCLLDGSSKRAGGQERGAPVACAIAWVYVGEVLRGVDREGLGMG